MRPTDNWGTYNSTSGAVELLVLAVGTELAVEVGVAEEEEEEEEGAGVEGMDVVEREVVPDGIIEDEDDEGTFF